MNRFNLSRPRLLGAYLVMLTVAADSAFSQPSPARVLAWTSVSASDRPVGPRLAPLALTDTSAKQGRMTALANVMVTSPSPSSPPSPSPRSGKRADLALMAVGGAALVIGALVGNDAGAVIAVGGGVIGLIGLYRAVR